MLRPRTQSGRKLENDVAQLSLICEQNSGTAVSFGPFPSSQTYRAIWPNREDINNTTLTLTQPQL